MTARHSAQLILYFTTLAFGGSLSYLLNIACIDHALTNHDMKRNDRIVVSQVIEVIIDYDPKSCSGICCVGLKYWRIFRIMKKSLKSKSKITEEEKREKIRAAMIKKKDLEKKTLKIVEQLLETGLSESFLIDVSSSLNQNFYADAVEERSLAGIMMRFFLAFHS